MTFLDSSCADVFRDRLLLGENISWSGKAGGGLLVTGRDVFLIPFSLLWGGFAIFWEVSVMKTNAPDSFDLFGIPFVLIGLYLIVGRFFADAWIRGHLFYAVTNKRILILRSGIGGKFTTLATDKLPTVTLSEKSNGRGTIRFGEAAPLWGNRSGFGMWTPSTDSTPQFLNIENVRMVFDRIQTLSANAKPGE